MHHPGCFAHVYTVIQCLHPSRTPLSMLLRCRCIPVRIDPLKTGPDSARVLLISAHGGKGMVFPKVRWLRDGWAVAALSSAWRHGRLHLSVAWSPDDGMCNSGRLGDR